MKKRIVMLFLAAVMAMQICLIPSGLSVSAETRDVNNFRDISINDWFYIYVKQLYEDNIINGVTEDSYSPNTDVKTSEVAALITRYLGLEHLAVKCKDFLVRNNVTGANLWYSGYIQLMCDTGIFDKKEIARCGVEIQKNGSAVISKNSQSLIDSPIKRMDMVRLIIRSFEIKSNIAKSANILNNEISGNGNEFITGGGYDLDTLNKIKNLISDYENIPDEYKELFLKCYYNGIVRGNEKGEVLPYNNLKRSELAKIIATVLYFDLRENDIRDIPEVCVIKSSDYSVSSVDGSRFLKKEKAVQILREQFKNINAVNVTDKNEIRITVNQKNIIPAGYLNEIYVYKYENGVAFEAGRINCATNTDEYFPKESAVSVSKSSIKSQSDFVGYIYLVLRDLNRGGEIAGAVMYNFDGNGNLKDASVYYLP